MHGLCVFVFCFLSPACRKLGVRKNRRIRIVKGSVMVDLLSGCYVLDSVSHSLINNSLVARKLPKNALTNLQWSLIDIPELTSVCFVLNLH